jgi:hypothetical protein
MLQPTATPQQSNYAQQMQNIICNTVNGTEEQFDLPPLRLFPDTTSIQNAAATGVLPPSSSYVAHVETPVETGM